MIIVDDPSRGEKKRFKGEAEASGEDKALVGGEKTLTVKNIFFQSDSDAQGKAESLLARMKDEKKYFEFTTELCPVPVERRDLLVAQEIVTPTKLISHPGVVRHIKLTVSPGNQTLRLIVEE